MPQTSQKKRPKTSQGARKVFLHLRKAKLIPGVNNLLLKQPPNTYGSMKKHGRGRKSRRECAVEAYDSSSDSSDCHSRERDEESALISMKTSSLQGTEIEGLESYSVTNAHTDNSDISIVYGFEGALRKIVFLLGIFALGAAFGDKAMPCIIKFLEILIVAWITCLIIIFLSWTRRVREDGLEASTSLLPSFVASTLLRLKSWLPPPLSACLSPGKENYINEREDHIIGRKDRIHEQEAREKESLIAHDDSEDASDREVEKSTSSHAILPSLSRKVALGPRQHPELENLFLINVDTMERVIPNGEPVKLDNEFFSGLMLLMIRPPDDNSSYVESDSGQMEKTKKVAEYFSGKQRHFEFQFQIKLKKIPSGPMFLGCELNHPIKLGMIQRAFVATALNFVRKMNKGFHYSLEGGDAYGNPPDAMTLQEGRYEKPHIAFTVEASVDRLVATKSGEPLPKLGEAIEEDSESIKSRKKGGMGNFPGWNLDDTYTIGLWSAYVDWLKWKCLNLPGIRPFSVSSVAGLQPINLTLYYLEGKDSDEKLSHYRCNMQTLSHLEISNSSIDTGLFAKKWLSMKTESVDQDTDSTEKVGEDIVEDLVDVADDPIDDDFDEDAEEEDDDMVEELGHGMYLRCGDPIVLREAKNIELGGDDVGFVTNGGGFAVLQSNSPSTIVIEKASPSHQSGNSKSRRVNRHKSKLIRCGDTVLVKLIGRNSEVKYLSTHRGWWLKWVSHMPRYNGYFKIITLEADKNLETQDKSRPFEMQSTFLSIGGTFSLRHRRWSRYEVGVNLECSATFGGRMLGLYKVGNSNAVDATENNAEEDDKSAELNNEYENGKQKRKWMKPFRMCANHASAVNMQPLVRTTISVPSLGVPSATSVDADKVLTENPVPHLGEVHLDVSAWVEMMHRSKRKQQRAYVVRCSNHIEKPNITEIVSKTHNEEKAEPTVDDSDTATSIATAEKEPNSTSDKNEACSYQAFFRLRTGRDLTPILQMGRSLRDTEVLSPTHVPDQLNESAEKIEEIDRSEDLSEHLNDIVSEDMHREHSNASLDEDKINPSPNNEESKIMVEVKKPVVPSSVHADFTGFSDSNWVKADNKEDLDHFPSSHESIDESVGIDGATEVEFLDDNMEEVEMPSPISHSSLLTEKDEQGIVVGDLKNEIPANATPTADSRKKKKWRDKRRKSPVTSIGVETTKEHKEKKKNILGRKSKKSKKAVSDANKSTSVNDVCQTVNDPCPIENFDSPTKPERRFSEEGVSISQNKSNLTALPLSKSTSLGIESSLERSYMPTSNVGTPEYHSDMDSEVELAEEIDLCAEVPGENEGGAECHGNDNEDREGEGVTESDFGFIIDTNIDGSLLYPLSPSKQKRKWINPTDGIGRVAKTVKNTTTNTGKHVLTQSKKVTLNTVGAGRAIFSKGITGRAFVQKPPTREPRKKLTQKASGKGLYTQKGKDYMIAMDGSFKTKKKSQLRDSNSLTLQSTRILAAQLSPPDQSVRMVSNVLSELTSTPLFGSLNSEFDDLFLSHLASTSELDAWFLRGDAAELGVVPTKNDNEKLLHGFLVARALWESHWREEWCGLYSSRLSFYAPLTKKPVFSLSFSDVQSIRRLDLPHEQNPLPGLLLLRIETTWRCHYLAFDSESTRETFHSMINGAIFNEGRPLIDNDRERWKASLWESFEASAASSLDKRRGKWAPISSSSSSKSKQRTVLNGRRMTFDLRPFEIEYCSDDNDVETTERKMGNFVETMLQEALSFSVESLEKSTKEFSKFLDKTCQLRSMPIHLLDFSSKEALCIFINIYHCLLQHALLLTVEGPPNKRSVGHFMRCSCYEIGGDIFSLAELECCVIRGKMSPPVNPKPPYVEAPKESSSHQIYAIGQIDPRINFILNNGSKLNLPTVPVLSPQILDMQMYHTCSALLHRQCYVDMKKRAIILPKVCEVYQNDFGHGDSISSVLFCLQFLDAETQEAIMQLIDDESSGGPLIKYQHSSDFFYSSLKPMS